MLFRRQDYPRIPKSEHTLRIFHPEDPFFKHQEEQQPYKSTTKNISTPSPNPLTHTNKLTCQPANPLPTAQQVDLKKLYSWLAICTYAKLYAVLTANQPAINVVKPVGSTCPTDALCTPVAVTLSASKLASTATANNGICSVLLEWAFSARWYFWKTSSGTLPCVEDGDKEAFGLALFTL